MMACHLWHVAIWSRVFFSKTSEDTLVVWIPERDLYIIQFQITKWVPYINPFKSSFIQTKTSKIKFNPQAGPLESIRYPFLKEWGLIHSRVSLIPTNCAKQKNPRGQGIPRPWQCTAPVPLPSCHFEYSIEVVKSTAFLWTEEVWKHVPGLCPRGMDRYTTGDERLEKNG